MPRYCSNCGAEVKGKFCESCGTAVGEENAAGNQNESKPNIPLSPPKKKKKNHGCLIVVIAVFVFFGVIGAIMSVSIQKDIKKNGNIQTSKKDSNDSKKDKNELSKEEAGKLDKKVWKIVMKVTKANNNMMDAMESYSSGNTSEYDFYSFCKETSDYCTKILSSIPKSKDESAKDYIKSSRNFVTYVDNTARSLVKYLDKKTNQNLSSVEANIESVKIYIGDTTTNRALFLIAHGYSDEELEKLANEVDEELE